jgi:hypothetical protein
MAGIVARLCERTAGRRVPALWPGGGLLHYTTHCVVVTAWRARSCEALPSTLEGPFIGGCGAARMTSTVLCGRGGSGRSIFTAGNGAELVSCAGH